MIADVGTARHLTELLGTRDRRVVPDRRIGERRHDALAVPLDRRGATRRQHQRRESASGHIRNALQMLEDLALLHPVGTPEYGDVATAARRLWLALREIELGNAGRHPLP